MCEVEARREICQKEALDEEIGTSSVWVSVYSDYTSDCCSLINYNLIRLRDLGLRTAGARARGLGLRTGLRGLGARARTKGARG